MYSPLGLVIFVAGTFVCFTKGHDHFISNYISCTAALKANWSDFLLSQCVRKRSLDSVLLFFSNRGRSLVIALSPSNVCWPLKKSDCPIVH